MPARYGGVRRRSTPSGLLTRGGASGFAHPTGAAMVAATGLLLLAAPPALAAGPGTGASETVLLAQIVVLLATGRLLGEAMQRIGQPAVMGQLLAGVLLGPSFFGLIWPGAQKALFPGVPEQKAMLDGIAQVGVLLLLLLTGMETDLKLVRKVGRASIAIATTGLAVPFALGFALGELLPASLLPRPELRLITSLFLGTALAISSVKIVAMVVRELDFMRRNIGQIIIASAIIEDTIGWIIIAITFGIATHGGVDLAAIAKSVLGTAAFLFLSFTVGRRLVARLIRWTNDSFVSELSVITAILIVMGLMAMLSHAIGVHTVLGAFVAGVLVGQSPILTRHIDEQLRGLITALFMPIFFAVAGLGADLTVLASPAMLGLSIGLIAIASLGKFAGAFLGSRFGGLTVAEAFAVGSGMNARGSTEVIVASIGLSMGALSHDLYTMIVAMAVLTTLAMPPMLRWALLRLPMGPEERVRLEREKRDAKSFVTSFERLLLTVDDSANARFAAHVAGLLAGSRQILTTVLQLDAQGGSQRRPVDGGPQLADVVKASAQAAQEAVPEAEEADAVEVTEKQPAPGQQQVSAAVESEARKGYDLLTVGLGRTCKGDGMIAERVSDIAQAFEGPTVIVDARGGHRSRPSPGSFSILLPIRATQHAQRAAEVAVELARASQSSIEVIFVSEMVPRRRRNAAAIAIGLEEEAALKKVVELADLHGVKARTSIERRGAPGAAIVRAAERLGRDLVVLGVSRRQGERLFFGKVAAEVLKGAPCSVLLVSS